MVLHDLKRMRVDVAFLQETHFRDDRLPLLRNRYFPLTYHATNIFAKSKGVSITISGKVPWKCSDTLVDAGGRCLFLKGTIGVVRVTLATIYAPSVQQDLLLRNTLAKLMDFTEGELILGSDVNVPLVPSVDTSLSSSSILPGSCTHISKSLQGTQ